jgi:uncharacterized protein with ParB-like and HNH nuclease domain
MQTEPDELLVEDSDKENDTAVAITYDIATYPSDFTLAGIAKMWADEDIKIPDFQREFVWTIQQSSLLVDSFLSGLPVPPVFFYIDEGSNKNLVIDGQQRILTVVFFLEGYFGHETTQGRRQIFRLQGLDEKSPYYKKRFIDLDDAEQRKFKQAVLRAVNIRQLGPIGESTSAYHIFERLNTGGTPLKPQEIRNVVFRGGLATKLKEANKDVNWRSILGKKDLDKHLKDVELLLRLFSLFNAVDKYEKPMKEFLNKSMKRHQKGDSKKVHAFLKVFPEVTEFIVKAIGRKPFHLRGPLNTSVLDSVMGVALENFGDIDEDKFKAGFDSLKEDDIFQSLTQTGTTDTKTLQDRFSLAEEHLLGE